MVFKRHPAGLCLAEGGSGGHLAILTRSAHIPAVFAAKDAHTLIQTGDSVVIDGRNARVYVAPDAKTAGSFRDGLQKQVVFRQKLSSLKNEPCLTKDGKKITLFANIGSPEEALTALDEGAEGIGLFRTEFLFMATETARREQCMSEDTQFEAYKSVLCIMKKKPVVIRTLDAGGDKFLTATGKDFDAAENPLLGQRSVRLSLARPDIFKVQLRALFRAGVYGNLRIMLPLVINSGEVQAVFSLIREVKKELTLENIPFKKNIPVGIMVETPAAALSSDVFARLCRFFSIGTNDLTQYTLAVDREDTAVSGLFNEFHCAVLWLIKTTLVNAQIAGIPVCVCGELAGMPEGAAVLAGMGIDTLSMTAFSIPKIKYFLSLFSSHDLELIAEEAVAAKRNTDNRTSLHALHFRQAAALCKKVLLP
jgi:phosphotransferase system enzyme I (PtsI)